MRYIDFSLIDLNDPEVKNWLRKAKENTRQLASCSTDRQRKAFVQKNNIWCEFKPVLIKYFGEKCWYSECDLTGSFGDVDHFRPKGKSTDENGKVILPEGYWWLAYDYLNYRLSCEKCNRSFGDGGKRDRFPLKPGTLPATVPDKDDTPLLLDPCVLQDVQVIDCDETGEIISLSEDTYEKERVNVSKKIYNWKHFNIARRKIRIECKMALEEFEVFYYSKPDRLDIPLKQLEKLTDERTPYSSFAKKYIKSKIGIENKPYAGVLSTLF